MSTRTRTRRPAAPVAPVITTETEPVVEPEVAEVAEVSTDLVVQVHEGEIVEESTDEPEVEAPIEASEPAPVALYTVLWFGAKDEALTFRGQRSRELLDDNALEAFRGELRPPVAGVSLGGKRRGVITIRAFDASGNVVAIQKPQALLAAERARTTAQTV